MSNNQTISSARIPGLDNIGPQRATNTRLASSTPSSLIGRSFGEYEITALLGCGGFGEVYRATHRFLDRPVAIKFLRNIPVDDTEAIQRFRREAQVAAQMSHPGIVRCTDGGVVGREAFLVTDLVDGSDLTFILDRHTRISIADVCEIGIQAANALHYVAMRNVVHRDVKPSNIMLDIDGRVRLLDLGLARSVDRGHSMTATGQVMGTIDYMAPEQAMDPRSVNHLADVYSLGATLYFLLVGRAPFNTDQHDTLAAKLLATMEAEPEPIKRYRHDVPTKLIHFVERMLDKEPSRRPSSFQSIAKELKQYAESANLVALVSSGIPAKHQAVETRSFSILKGMVDCVEVGLNTVIRLLGQAVGFVEAIPITRPGQRQCYRYSFAWVRSAALVGLLFVVIWLSGVRFGGFTRGGMFPNSPSNPATAQSNTVYETELFAPNTPPAQDQYRPVQPSNAPSAKPASPGGIRFNPQVSTSTAP